MTKKGALLLTVNEAATALAIRPKTIRAWIAARRIGVVKVNGWALRVPVSEVERLIDEGSIPAAA